MARIHHSAIVTRDIETSLRFWRDGLGFTVTMDQEFDGDWPTLLGSTSTRLRSVFLGPAPAAGGDPGMIGDDAGIVELVDFGSARDAETKTEEPAVGFFLLSLTTDLDTTLGRLADLGLGGPPRRVVAYGTVGMATVRDPNGVLVELIDGQAVASAGG